MIPTDYKELGQSAIAQSLLGANIFFWDDSSYFAAAAETKPLLHTWSLAVEEQFYVLFPLGIAFFWKDGRGRLLRRLTIALLISLIASLPGPAWFPGFAFYWLPTRAWELICGAALVFLPNIHDRRLAALSAAMGLGALFVAIFGFSEVTPFPGIAAVLPCFGTALLILSGATCQTWIHRLLSSPPLVFFGLISYSLYLWHWPVMVFSRKFLVEKASVGFLTFQIGLSLFLAIISWRFVETPFRRKSWLPERHRMLRFGVGSMVLITLCGTLLSATKGFPARLPHAVRLLTSNPPGMKFTMNEGCKLEDIQADRVPRIGAASGTKPDFVIWGDSHAMAAHPIFDVLGRENGRSGYLISRRGTAPVLDTWRPADGKSAVAFNAAALDFIKRHRIRQVFMISYWAIYVEPGLSGTTQWLITDNEREPLDPDIALRTLRRQMGRTLEALREADVDICILRQVPEQDIHVQDILSARLLTGLTIDNLGTTFSAYQRRQRRVNTMLDEFNGERVQILDTFPSLMDRNSRSLLVHDGRATFVDQGHLSVTGSLMLRPLLEPFFLLQPAAKN